MILTVEVFGVIDENAYFFIDDETRHGFLIDPGAQADKLLKIIGERNFTVEKILLTHGHFDHIGAVNEIQRALKIPVCMSKGGNYYAKDPAINCSAFVGEPIILNDVTCLPDDTEIVLDANKNFGVKLIPAPGHTTDGAIYYSAEAGVAFVGDTIFCGSYGRTDLPGGSHVDLMRTIREKVLTLPDETILYTGHGSQTTVAAEKNFWY
ncbi:MAG: MBL fold metallo-hydrolase [Quinella sp. 3Q1]|nr:MBL fold metallo-hydrolase [Quinella sp. 3Q1]MBR6889290.1 MBL fold metallo-hydrolase [Selenomonadaceae bacterium]